MSPRMPSAPSARRARAESSDRARAFTSRPSARRRSTIAPPTNPVPPVTKAASVSRTSRTGPTEAGQVFDGGQHRDRGRNQHRPLVQKQRAQRLVVAEDGEQDGHELDVRLQLAPDRRREHGSLGRNDASEPEDQELAPDDDHRDPDRSSVDVDEGDQPPETSSLSAVVSRKEPNVVVRAQRRAR